MEERYSLWLVPDEDSTVHENLESLIREHSQEYADAPRFKPHITVVGGVGIGREKAEKGAERIARRHSPVDIELLQPHCSTTRYQCVFLLAEPTLELMELHRDTSHEYGHDAGMYVPHLSLVYSDMPLEERRRLVEEFDTGNLPLRFVSDTLRLVRTGGESGTVEEWQVIGDYGLD